MEAHTQHAGELQKKHASAVAGQEETRTAPALSSSVEVQKNRESGSELQKNRESGDEHSV
jgi:hypothetical protein